MLWQGLEHGFSSIYSEQKPRTSKEFKLLESIQQNAIYHRPIEIPIELNYLYSLAGKSACKEDMQMLNCAI
jgi:hypothetical protein